MPISQEQIAYMRFSRSNLVEPFKFWSPEECTANVLGMQSQIFTAGSLNIGMRHEVGTHEDLLQHFREKRTLLRTWGQRATVHMYATMQLPLMANVFRGDASWSRKQFIKFGGKEDAFEDLIATAAAFLREKGSCTRQEINAVTARFLPGFEAVTNWGGVLIELGKRGHLLLGGYEKGAGQQLLYSPYAWYDSYPDPMVHPDAKDLNPKLMEMYFGDYGPATLADFAHWRGVSMKKAKDWLAEVNIDRPHEINGQEYYFYSGQDRRWLEEQDVGPTDLPSTLLYRFDPLILAHKDKRWLIRESDYKKVWRIAAHVEGVVLKHGRIVGVWKFKRKAKRLDFQVCHFRTRERLGKRILEKKLNRVARYLGYTDWEWREEEY